MKILAQKWRRKADEAARKPLDTLGDGFTVWLEHGELGDLYYTELDELVTRGMVFASAVAGSCCNYILYPFDEAHSLPDAELFLNDMKHIGAARVSR